MNLSQKIAAELEGLTATPASVLASVGTHRLTLSVLRAGPIGVEADALEFAVLDQTDWSIDALRAWADRLAARVTYLMEPLTVVEVDAQGGEVELRSQAPTPRQGRRSYYEARLDRRGTLRLHRVSFDEATRERAPVSFQITTEVLQRLADDLVDLVS
ncbi:MAG: hypothetical protein ABI353_03060 [Isosphaeraceae bacterium]